MRLFVALRLAGLFSIVHRGHTPCSESLIDPQNGQTNLPASASRICSDACPEPACGELACGELAEPVDAVEPVEPVDPCPDPVDRAGAAATATLDRVSDNGGFPGRLAEFAN